MIDKIENYRNVGCIVMYSLTYSSKSYTMYELKCRKWNDNAILGFSRQCNDDQ